MNLTIHLTDTEIKKLLLKALREEYPGASSVSLDAGPHHDMMDRPTGGYIVSATVNVRTPEQV